MKVRFGVGLGGSFLAPTEAARARESIIAAVVADSWPVLHRLVDGYVDAGLTKFVISTVGSVPTRHFIDDFVRELLPRQN